MRSSRRFAAVSLCGLALSVGAGAVALTQAASAAAAQTTLAFDDLGASTAGTHMLDGYGGFNWTTSSWHFMSLAAAPQNTYLALSGTATSIHFTGGADFIFDGADFWSRRGLDANGTFYFVLSRDGAMVYDGRNDRDGRQRFTATPTTFTTAYTGPVDTVAVVFAQGGDDWDHLAMDNFRFTLAEPAAPAPTPTPPTTTAPAPTPGPAPAPVTTFKLTVKTNGKGSVAASRTGATFVAGTLITLTATPAAGQTWRGWSGAVTSTDRTITVTIDKALTLTANFR